ncbi:MAG TPA: HlyD family secretion protein [Alphaproteobacteria bacterium]|nr:HlyD family secretion protein [Alphaproteobacteria bacterium]
MDSAITEREIAVIPTISRPKLDMRRLALLSVAAIVVLAAALYGRTWWTVGRFVESTDDAYVGGNITPIAPHIDGFVARVLVDDNQRVQAGQLLIQLDPRDYQAALDHAEAVLNARLATIESLHARYVLQQSAIRQQEADLLAKSARASFADQDAVRYKTLEAKSFGSRQDAERTLALQQEARSAVASAQAGLEAARQQLKVIDAQVAEANAAVAQAQSDLRTAELNLSYTEIRSPIDGYVGNRAAQVGAYVTKSTYLISITPATGLWVDANFKEDQLTHMTPSQPATVEADILPGHPFRGHVVSMAPGTGAVFSIIPPENATGNFTKIVQRVPVRIVLDAGDEKLSMLRPGLSTTVNVDTRDSQTEAP